MIAEPDTTTAPPSPLWAILADLKAAGIRQTPLGVLCRATNLHLPDQAIDLIVDEFAAGRGLDEVAA